MSAAAPHARRSVDPALLPPRWVLLSRAGLLVAVGLVVTFSATFHEQFGFDLTLVAVALAAIGAVALIEAVTRRGRGGVAVAAAYALVSVAAAVLLVSLASPLAFAVVIGGWGVAVAVLEFLGMVTLPGSRQDAALVGAAGLLLALVVLLARADLVAVIGFFGAYAIVAGVFLGIAALDARRSAAADGATSAPVGDAAMAAAPASL